MKVLVAVGSPYSGCQELFDTLTATGVASARPGRKEQHSAHTLQALILRSHEVDLNGTAPLEQLKPGKVWSDLASDFFLANIDQAAWGWADHQSAPLLDFWQQFDPQVRLLISYTSPAEYLAKALAEKTPATADMVEHALRLWFRWNTSLLRYYHRNTAHCLLVDSVHARNNLNGLVSLIATQWQVRGLQVPPERAHAPDAQGPHLLQTYLANQLIDPQHAVWSVQQELDACANLPSASTEQAQSPLRAWDGWTAIHTEREHARSADTEILQLQGRIEPLMADLAQARVRADELLARHALLTNAHAEATKASGALAAERDRLAREVTKLQSDLGQSAQESDKMTALAQDNELLRLQLDQVQEELELYFRKYQDLAGQQGKAASAGFASEFWRMHQPEELRIDMRQEVAGDNWYPAEKDGRWAGPELHSTVHLPRLQAGEYMVEMDIVDALEADIVEGLQFEAFGENWPVEVEYPLTGHLFPVVCRANFVVPEDAAEPWKASLRFPRTASPAAAGSADHRSLAVRLRTMRLVKRTTSN